MCHLQKAFIAKAKTNMQKKSKKMQRSLLLREATRVTEVGVHGSKKDPKKRKRGWTGGMFLVWHHYDVAPSHLVFTLKR